MDKMNYRRLLLDFDKPLSKKRIKEIKIVVDRIFKEYGEVIKKLN